MPKSSPAHASAALVGRSIKGQRREGLWKVKEQVERKPDATGGTFSVGYIVENEDGTVAFMKATDIGLLARGSDGSNLLQRARYAFQEQEFERAILDVCRGNNMDRMVIALDYGDFPIEHEGTRDVVFFIVFELANGDVRSKALGDERLDFSWSLHALHNLTVAINQLHSAKISHNDIKPSNLLIFEELLQKLADVGRATSAELAGPFDVLPCPGDQQYAAPEQLYSRSGTERGERAVPFSQRQASDLYLLGSMCYFFVTGVMITPMVMNYLRIEHHPANWTGTFSDVLPYWREALGASKAVFDQTKPTSNDPFFAEAIARYEVATWQLCEPDPLIRGHPSNRIGMQNRFGIQRYISLFDLLRRRVVLSVRRG